MVYPKSLYEFGRSCTSSKTCGNILRALCGQKVSLSPSERTILAMVDADSRDMDERLEVRRTAERERKAAYRQKRAECGASGREVSRIVPRDNTGQDGTIALSHGTGLGQNGVPHHTDIQTDIHTDIQTESVYTSRPPAREDGTSYEQEGSGCGQPQAAKPSTPSLPDPLRRCVPPLAAVVAAAESTMGVPGWYAEWWYRNMAASGWTTTKGERVGDANWRALLKAWHNRAQADGREYDRIRAEAKAREREAAAHRNPTAMDWALCAERCAAFREGRCARGKSTSPTMPPWPRPPEECDGFAPMTRKASSMTDGAILAEGDKGEARSV